MSSHLQQNRGQKPLREGEHQEGETGAQGLPSSVLPSEASQLPPLSPPPDLAAVYSYAVTRKSRRTPGQRRCPHATPDWLGPSPSHCPTPPPLLGPPPPTASKPCFRFRCSQTSKPVGEAPRLSSATLIGSGPCGPDQETEAHQKGGAACPWSHSPLGQKSSRIPGSPICPDASGIPAASLS